MLAVTMLVVAFALTGCFSLSSAISGAMANQATAGSTPNATQPADPPAASQARRHPRRMGAAYQYQFNAFYGAMWTLGWFGYKDANYQPGQGTIWEITSSSKGSKGPTTFERAFLKLNKDKSQWWRLRIKGSKEKEEIVYELLVGADTLVQKVRYKDPDSGQVGEFVPDQSTLGLVATHAGTDGQLPDRHGSRHGASRLIHGRSLRLYRSQERLQGRELDQQEGPWLHGQVRRHQSEEQRHIEWRAGADRDRDEHGPGIVLAVDGGLPRTCAGRGRRRSAVPFSAAPGSFLNRRRSS